MANPNSGDHHIDDFRPGAKVMTSDGEHVGSLHEVIVDADDDEITRIVVNAGPHFPAIGFGAPKLISVPTEDVESVDENLVTLRCSRPVFEHFPVYADWVATAGRPAAGPYGGGSIGWAYKLRDRGPTEREIDRGAHVWLVEPPVHIGDVERILMDDETEQVTALIMRVGLLLGHLVILPIDFVVDFADAVIHVQMTNAQIEALEPFEDSPDE